MKRFLTLFLTLSVLLFVTLCSVGCSSDDEDTKEGYETLTINGERYYVSTEFSSVSQTKRDGMFLNIYAFDSKHHMKEICFSIPQCKVSELSVGETIDYYDIYVENFDWVTAISFGAQWEAIAGNISITDIKDKSITIRINKLKVQRQDADVEREVEGTVTLYHSLHDGNGIIPFSEF